MHLKSLTLQGFKSFASATTLRFEPGITAVVGPNGSGKSNVVDAIAWVLGEQGAKALRGGKMEDVIFAGTAGRPPLGRAEVTLTIDNSDGALPIDYTEVSITRRMFRDGASEYEINGERCRLLDIQELLSDSGIGREMHVIVGQGQLDSVLQARPEDRRGFIEEAAGVLKHRKRKEKALRKLDAMQANLTRAHRPDRRAAPPAQAAGPAGRDRPPGRRASRPSCATRGCGCWPTTCVDLRDELRKRGRRRGGDPQPARRGRGRARRRRAPRESELEQAIAADAPRSTARPGDLVPAVRAARSGFRGTASLAAERARHLSRRARRAHGRAATRRRGGRGRRGPRRGGRAAGELDERPGRAGRRRRRAAGARTRPGRGRAGAGRGRPGRRRPPRGPGQAGRAGQRAAHPRRRPAATRSPGSPRPPADARDRARRPTPSSTRCRPRSARSTRASSASTSGTRRPSPRCEHASRPASAS